MDKRLLSMLIFVICIFSGVGQMWADATENEPNNPCGTGIANNTITANGVYSGSLNVGPDSYDYWYINTGSSGDITIELSQISMSVSLKLVECTSGYCSGTTTVMYLTSDGASDTYTLSSDRNYHILIEQFGGGPGMGDYSFTLSGDASLPVHLSSFSASCKGEAIILKWITESEIDNQGYILERSVNNKFWMTIASYQTHDALKVQDNKSSRTEYIFTDNEVEFGKQYYYRLSDVSTTGVITQYPPLCIQMDQLPETTIMENAYPNPFNPQTFISYKLSEATTVKIKVYDMQGRSIKTLFNGKQAAGSYHVYWNGTNKDGMKVSTGNYMIRMETENTMKSQKVLFIK